MFDADAPNRNDLAEFQAAPLRKTTSSGRTTGRTEDFYAESAAREGLSSSPTSMYQMHTARPKDMRVGRTRRACALEIVTRTQLRARLR